MAGLGVQGQAAQAQGTGRILEWPKVWLVAQADWSSPAHPSASTVGCGRAPEECSDGPKRVHGGARGLQLLAGRTLSSWPAKKLKGPGPSMLQLSSAQEEPAVANSRKVRR
ncbi:hypothetical protein ABBQ38_014386 [Trebouxia sp. C0009 RCD-2024]